MAEGSTSAHHVGDRGDRRRQRRPERVAERPRRRHEPEVARGQRVGVGGPRRRQRPALRGGLGEVTQRTRPGRRRRCRHRPEQCAGPRPGPRAGPRAGLAPDLAPDLVTSRRAATGGIPARRAGARASRTSSISVAARSAARPRRRRRVNDHGAVEPRCPARPDRDRTPESPGPALDPTAPTPEATANREATSTAVTTAPLALSPARPTAPPGPRPRTLPGPRGGPAIRRHARPPLGPDVRASRTSGRPSGPRTRTPIVSTRRRTIPSTDRRPRCTTTSTALTSCAWTAAGVIPASAPRASNRATTSAAPLACSVPQPPSWPVLSAASSSRTSAPRASPRTIRSGRIRSACRTNVVRVTSPAPSTFGGRASSRTTCGRSTRSSRTSSTTTTRSPAADSPSSAPRRVVFPTPVPPDTTKATRRSTSRRSNPPHPGGNMPPASRSARLIEDRAGTRSVRCGPSPTSGGRIACNRTPDGSTPSTYGEVSSSRRPARPARRTASRRTASGPPTSTSARTIPSPASTHTEPSPFTATSVTPGRSRSGSSGPAPSRSACREPRRAATPPRPSVATSTSATVARVSGSGRRPWRIWSHAGGGSGADTVTPHRAGRGPPRPAPRRRPAPPDRWPANPAPSRARDRPPSPGRRRGRREPASAAPTPRLGPPARRSRTDRGDRPPSPPRPDQLPDASSPDTTERADSWLIPSPATTRTRSAASRAAAATVPPGLAGVDDDQGARRGQRRHHRGGHLGNRLRRIPAERQHPDAVGARQPRQEGSRVGRPGQPAEVGPADAALLLGAEDDVESATQRAAVDEHHVHPGPRRPDRDRRGEHRRPDPAGRPHDHEQRAPHRDLPDRPARRARPQPRPPHRAPPGPAPRLWTMGRTGQALWTRPRTPGPRPPRTK